MLSSILIPILAVLAVPIDARAVPGRRAVPSSSASASVSISVSASASTSSASASATSVNSASIAAASASASISASLSASAAAYSSSVSASAAQASATAIPSGWVAASQSCIAEGPNGRALGSATLTSDSMTWNQCVTYCSNAGYSLAGVEYGRECYCSNVLQNGAALSKTSSNCNMNCAGSATSNCGGPAAIKLFVAQQALATLNDDLNGPRATAALPAGWSAASTPCIAEGTSGRSLTGATYTDNAMTVPKCLNYCQTKGFQYAGVEYGTECYCGRDLSSGSSLTSSANAQASCNMPCGGDNLSTCGGPNSVQLYQNPSYALSNPMVDGYNGYRYQGCIQEVAGRALVGKFADQTDMTVETCIGSCYRAGYAYAALEYGSQCFCASGLSNGASLTATSTQCNMPCAGNRYETCGGPNAVQLYKTTKFKATS